MFSFFKQIFKSLKKFFFLLFGIIFVLFSIVFLETSVLQLSNNLVGTYTKLVQNTNASDIVSPAIFKDVAPKYTSDLKQENGYYSKLTITDKKINYLFPYLESDFGEDSNQKDKTTKAEQNNPRDGDVNKKDKLFLARKRGILKAYGEADIAEKRIYKGLAVSFDDTASFNKDKSRNDILGYAVSDPTNLIYDKDGNLLGYFIDGLIHRTIPLRTGIARFPGDKGKDTTQAQKPKAKAAQQAKSDDPTADATVASLYRTENKKKIWFESDETQPKGGGKQDTDFGALYLFNGGNENANWFPNLYANFPINLEIDPESQFWLDVNPFKEIIEVFRDQKEEKTNQSFALNFKLETTKLNQLDRDEFQWLKTNATKITANSPFGNFNLQQQINNLEQFDLKVNKDWLKNKLIKEKDTILDSLPGFSNSDKDKIFNDKQPPQPQTKQAPAAPAAPTNGVNDPDFNKVKTAWDKIQQGDKNPEKTQDAVYAALLNQWRGIFQEDLTKKLSHLLEKHRDDFLKAKVLENIDLSRQDMAIATNVSSEESASFLISNKDHQKYNDLSIVSGDSFKPWNFEPTNDESNPIYSVYGGKNRDTGFFQSIDYEFKPSSPKASTKPSGKAGAAGSNTPKSIKFKIYPKLANLIAQAQQPEGAQLPKSVFEIINKWKTLDYAGFQKLDENKKQQAANEYIALLSYFTPQFQSPDDLVSTNRQELEIPITLKNGVNPLILPTNFLSLEIQTPEAHAAVVSEQWLFKHGKQILPKTGEFSWQEAKKNPKNLPNWLNDLPDKYKFSLNNLTFAILGTGESVETGYPVLSQRSPIPNVQDEGLIFVNDQGYRSVLFAAPAAIQENYYAFKSSDLKKITNENPISFLSKKLNGYLDVPKGDLAFNVKDISKQSYLTTFRNYFPDLVQRYLAIASAVIAIFLSILALYLTILLIKSFIKKNQTEFAIIRAGGFSLSKFIAGMSVFAGIAALTSSFLGVLFAFLLESQVKGIVSRYWFIALPANSFNWLSFFGSAVIIFCVFQLISWIAFKQLFSKPVNVLIDQGNETKFSVFLHLLKGKSHTMSPLTKFRVSLIVSRLSRLFTYVGLSSIALLLIGIAGTIPQKFSAAQANTALNRDFNYKLNLQTPTEQSGWYAVQPYSQFGQTNESAGIKSLYNEQADANSDKDHPYKPSQLVLKDRDNKPLKDSAGKDIQLGNLLLPSFGGAQKLGTDENFFRHASLSKWLIDFPINVGGTSINPWEIVEKSIPKQISQLLSASSDQFLTAVLTDEYFNNLNNNGFLIRNPRTNFIQLDSQRVLTTIDVFNPGKVRFNDNFLNFMLKVYGDPKLAVQDSKLTYGIIPLDPKIEEPYTYVEGPFGFSRDKLDPNSPYTLTGISPRSKFVNLTDASGKSLSHLLNDVSEKNYKFPFGPFPVIVNAGFQYANNIHIGDKLYIKPTNTATRFSEKFLAKPPVTPTYEFKVVGVSTDAFGQELYINQLLANLMLKLEEEPFVNDAGVIEDVVQSTDKKKWEIKYAKQQREEIAFNGIFSKELNPSLISKALVLMSTIGVWGNFVDFGNNFTDLVKGKIDKVITSILPSNPDILRQLAKEKNISKKEIKNHEDFLEVREQLVDQYKKEWSDVNVLASQARSIFGNNITIPALNLTGAGASAQIIRNNAEVLFNTVNQVDGFLLGTIIPFIFITCVVLGISMLEEMKRIFIALKSFGYKDSQNLVSLLTFFIPAFLLSLVISIGLLAGILVGIQALVFGVAQVFLTNMFEFLPYLVGLAVFGITIFTIGTYFWIKLRSVELKEGF